MPYYTLLCGIPQNKKTLEKSRSNGISLSGVLPDIKSCIRVKKKEDGRKYSCVQRRTYSGRCSCLFDSSPLFYSYTLALPQAAPSVRPNGTEESTCLSRAYTVYHCTVFPLICPSHPSALSPSPVPLIYPSIPRS